MEIMGKEVDLQAIKNKVLEHAFSKDDAAILCNIVAQNPCYLEAQLLLLEYAKLYWRFFPQSWTEYFQVAKDNGEKCWEKEELVEIYLLGGLLYSYDQNTQLQREATAKAFELAPNDWQAIIAYLGQFRETLPQNIRMELVGRISQNKPEHPRAYYAQARYFEEYMSQSGEKQYRDAAIKAYEMALEVGVNIPHNGGIPRRVLEDSIERLRK